MSWVNVYKAGSNETVVLFSCLHLLGSELVIGGDGRYHNSHAMQTILRMAAANGVCVLFQSDTL